MTVKSDNITATLSNLFDSSQATKIDKIEQIEAFFTELKHINKEYNILENHQNLDTWARNKKIPFKKNSKSIPLIEKFLEIIESKHKDRMLYEKICGIVKKLKTDGGDIYSAQLNHSILFQANAIKITSPISRNKEKLTNLSSHISGLYITTRYRFNITSQEFPIICQEVIYIYPGKTGSHADAYPHFVYWYKRQEEHTARCKGVGYPAGNTYWLQGFDDEYNFRSRVMVLTAEDDLNSSLTNKETSKVRGGIMISDTQDNHHWPAACRVIMEKQEVPFIRKFPTYSMVKMELENFAEENLKFILEEDFKHPKKEQMLHAIDNKPYSQNRNLLLMPQSTIDDLL